MSRHPLHIARALVRKFGAFRRGASIAENPPVKPDNMGAGDPYWPEVVAALEAHGEGALDWAMVQIDDLVEDGDLDGVDRMIEIARRLHSLRQRLLRAS